ncbi:MAG: hypothetical protein ACOCRO_08495, partial [Halanaerobiales bacterium]
MIKVNYSQINQFKRDLRRVAWNQEQFRYLYFQYLYENLNIGEKLREKIEQLVYQQGKDNKWYVRTKRLLEAVRVELEDNSLVMYMDDDFLEEGKEYQEMSEETGYDPSAHEGGNADKSYAERVEKGY